MVFFKNEKLHFFLAVSCVVLFIIIFKWIHYLVKHNYVTECMSTSNANINNVNIPLTTSYSCSNFCGPTSRCSKSGHQCVADSDCPGCQPYAPPLKKTPPNIRGENDAGKLTGVAPQYSTLTTDIGTQAALFNSNPLSPPPQANFGINTWSATSNELNKMYNSRFKPKNMQFEPDYPNNISTTGLYLNNDPLASNAYITIH
jgi:hypothetical protein